MWKYVLTAEYISLLSGWSIPENEWEFKTYEELCEEVRLKKEYFGYIGTADAATIEFVVEKYPTRPQVVLIKYFLSEETGKMQCMTIFKVKRVE